MIEQHQIFCLPDLGEGLTEAEIVSWHVSTGDRVVADQPLVTVETDKAIVDIPSPQAGIVSACLAEPGEVVEVGSPLVQFSTDAVRVDAGAVVGELTQAEAPPPTEPSPDSGSRTAPVRASPQARNRARVLGVSLAEVTPTGPDGVVQVADVEAAAGGTGEVLTGVRRAMSRRMADAHARVARASVTGEADISNWHAEGRPMLRLIRAVAEGAAAVGRMNAWYDDAAGTLSILERVDLGIAMEMADGLLVPVLADVASKTPDTLADELEALEKAVAERTVPPDALKGQTITLSNFGAVGGLHAEMVVVPPQVAIVGAGRIFERLVMGNGDPVQARILPLSVSFDHRVVTGVEACRFLNAMIQDLEPAV